MPHFSIELDRPDRRYCQGDTVRCTIRLSTRDSTKYRSIYVRFKGFAEVKWTESRQVQRNGKSHTEHTTYRAEEIYFKHYETLQGVQGGPEQQIQSGNYVYHAYFQLPKNLPQDFEGDNGFIRYEVKAHMDVPWGFDVKEEVPFYMKPYLDLNEFPHLLEPVRAEAAKTFGCCCWESEPLHIFNVLPKRGFIAGEETQYTLEINNDSDVAINEASVKLTEYITFHARSPRQKTRESKRVLWSYEFSNPVSGQKLMQRMQNKIFSTDIAFNADSYKFFQGCGIISVEYKIKSEAHVPGCHTNLDNYTSITIGTVPFGAQGLPSMAPMVPYVPLAPMLDNKTMPLPTFPTAPLDSVATAPPDTIVEQPLPTYNDAIFNSPNLPPAGSQFGWAVHNSEDTPPPTFLETLALQDDTKKE